MRIEKQDTTGTATVAKKYAWNGKIWFAPVPGADRVVSECGFEAAIDQLLLALFEGRALEVTAQAADVLMGRPSGLEKPNLVLVKNDNVKTNDPIVAAALAKLNDGPKAGDMDTQGKGRAEAKIAFAKEQGVALPSSQAEGLFFDVGTAVMPEAWASERKAFDKLPLGEEKLPKVAAQIKAEDRADFEFGAWDLRMSPRSGKIGDPKNPEKAWEPTRRGLQSFTSRASIGSIPEHWPTDIKANSINALCKRFGDERPRELLVNGDAPQVSVRVQRARGKAFAVVSPHYSSFDGDKVMEALEKALPKGSRVAVDYDADAARGKVEIITLQQEQPVVGEPFKTSLVIGWDDTGSGSLWGDGGLWSARCLNLTRIFTSAGSFRMRHVGSVIRLAKRFTEEFERIAAVVHKFAVAYGHAAQDELTNTERVEGTEFIQGVYRSLLQRDLIPIKGKREEAVRALAMHHVMDENGAGLTRAGVSNAISRYAHKTNNDPWLRDELERAAGRIVWSTRPVRLDYLARDAA